MVCWCGIPWKLVASEPTCSWALWPGYENNNNILNNHNYKNNYRNKEDDMIMMIMKIIMIMTMIMTTTTTIPILSLPFVYMLQCIIVSFTLLWRHNGHDCVPNHQLHHCLLNCLFGRISKKTSQSSASLAFAWGIHRGPVNSPHKWPVTRKMSLFDDVIMYFENKCKYEW